MAVMDPTRKAQPNGHPSTYAWQGTYVPTATTTVVAETVRTESITVNAAGYHRGLAAAFAQRPKAADDKPLDFDPDEL